MSILAHEAQLENIDNGIQAIISDFKTLQQYLEYRDRMELLTAKEAWLINKIAKAIKEYEA